MGETVSCPKPKFHYISKHQLIGVIFGSFQFDPYRVSVHQTVCLAYLFIEKQNFAIH